MDEWVFQGEATSTPFGMAATVGWPKDEWGFNPGSYSELRPGCFDVHERVRDMDANGVLASMNFPTMAGFNARTFNEAGDKELALVSLQAYNDWAIDEWAGTYPDRFIPLGLVPMWDVDLAVEEVHRLGKKGCRSISFLETPARAGLPELPVRPLGPDVAGDLRQRTWSCRCTSAPASRSSSGPPEAPVDHLMVLACQISAITAQDLLFGPTLRKFPDLRVALSEGGIGWIPFYLDRIDRHFTNQEWLHGGDDFGGKMPSEVFREHILACYITDPSGLLLRDRIGMDNIAWECDYPHTDTTWPESPEYAWKELQDASCSDDEIHKITWQNACRFFDWEPFAAHHAEDATVGALRARATRTKVDVTRMPRAEWKKRNEAAGIGVLATSTDRALAPGAMTDARRSSTSTTTTTRPRTPSPGTRIVAPQPGRALGRHRRPAAPARRRDGQLLRRQPDVRPRGQARVALRLVPRQPEAAVDRRGVRRARADPARVPRPRRPPEGDGRAGPRRRRCCSRPSVSAWRTR